MAPAAVPKRGGTQSLRREDSGHLFETRPNRISERFLEAGLFLDQPTLKDRPRIKAGVIGPPKTPSVFMPFLNWEVNQ
jgi:hypothetical protein